VASSLYSYGLGDLNMQLTREILEQGKSVNGSWSAKQLKCFDIAYPWPKGWEQEIIGKEYSVAAIDKFLSLTNAHLKDGKNVFQQKQEAELKRAEKWANELKSRRTRKYEIEVGVLDDCPFPISQRQIDAMVRYGATDRMYSIVTDPDFIEEDEWSKPIHMEMVERFL